MVATTGRAGGCWRAAAAGAALALALGLWPGAAAAESIEDAFSLRFTERDGAPERPLRDAHRYPLDINETVELRVDTYRLGAYGAGHPNPDLAAANGDLAALTAALRGLEDLPARVEALAEHRQRVLGLTRGTDAFKAELAAFREASTTYEVLWGDLKARLKAYYAEQAAPGDPSWNDLMQDPTRQRLAAWMRGAIERDSERTARAHAAAVATRPPVALTLRADLARAGRLGDAVAVHLPGYDDGAYGDARFEDKASFVRSAAERREIDRAVALAGELGRIVDNARAGNASLKTTFERAYEALQRAGADLPSKEDVAAWVADLRARWEAAAGDAERLGAPVREAWAEVSRRAGTLKETLDASTASVAALRGGIDELRGAASGAALFQAVRGLTQTASEAAQRVQAFQTAAEKLAEAVETFSRQVKTSARGLGQAADKLDGLAAFAVEGPRQWVAPLAAFLGAHGALAELGSPLDQAGPVLAGAGDASLHPIAVPLDEVTDTRISLPYVPARDGDRVLVTAELAETDPERTGVVRQLTAQGQLRVARLGWSTHVSGDLLFARRESAGSFGSATGISYVYRYRPWAEDTKPKRLLRQLNPGLGITVAALNFSGNAAETGIALTGTLLRGLLSVGYGRNLQESTDPWFFFFGLRFLALPGFQIGGSAESLVEDGAG